MKSIFFCLFCACQRRAERWEEPRLPGKKAAERGDPQKQGKHRRRKAERGGHFGTGPPRRLLWFCEKAFHKPLSDLKDR